MSEIEKTCPSKRNFFCVMYSTILSTVSGFILVLSFGSTVFKIVEDPLSTLFANRQTDCNSFLSYEGSTADVNELFAPFLDDGKNGFGVFILIEKRKCRFFQRKRK